MRKSVTKRIKITKSGKMKRRAMTLGHSRGNKNSVQMKRKKLSRNLVMRSKTLKNYF